MIGKFHNQYRIPATRIQNWDDTWNGKYFITLCTAKLQNLFGEISNHKMILSPVGILAFAFWYEIKNQNKNIELDAFVVMPNHLHGIVTLKNKFDHFNTSARQIKDIKIEKLAEDDPMRGILEEVDESYLEYTRDMHGSQPKDFLQCNIPTTLKPAQSFSLRQIDPLIRGGNPAMEFPSSDSINEFFRQQLSKNNQSPKSVCSIINTYKSAVTSHALRLGYSMDWKEHFYTHLIHNDEELRRIRFYINTNPGSWERDRFYG